MPSKSKAQQRYMGMVHACKKSDYKDCASKEVEDTARGMKDKDAKDFASTKHKGLPDKKETNEMKDLIKQMVREAIEEPSEDQERAWDDIHAPLEGQELLDALASDISDMFKDINGMRPRWIKFSEMPLSELEKMHDQVSADHEAWWSQERVEQDLDDLAWHRGQSDQQRADDELAASYQADRDAEEEKMKEPEEGEEFPKRTGMRRRMSENRMRRDTANKLYNLLIMEQEYGIITPQELAELKGAINKVLGVSVGNLMEIFNPGDRSPAVEKAFQLEHYQKMLMNQIDKILATQDAQRAGLDQAKINRIRKGLWRVLTEGNPTF